MPLHVGGSLTHSSQGFAFFKLGVLEGGICIGHNLPNTGTGTLSIVGSGTQVSAKTPRDLFRLREYGTLIFKLDSEGVSTLDYQKSEVQLAKDALIRIEGNAYKGDAKTIILLSARNIRNEGVRFEYTGFPEGLKATASIEKIGLVLRIKKQLS